MKKLIVLMLIVISSSLTAFDTTPGKVIDGNCDNGKVLFKYFYSNKPGSENCMVFAKIDYPNRKCYGDIGYILKFLDEDGFCWHETLFSEVNNPLGVGVSFNDAIEIPSYAWGCVSTHIHEVKVN